MESALRVGALGARGVAWAALIATGWTIAASVIFMSSAGLMADPTIPTIQRPVFWWLALDAARAGRLTPEELMYLVAGFVVPSSMLIALGRLWIMHNGGWRGAAQAALGLYLVVRSSSHTHGKADWMPMAEVCKLFPAEPDPDIGGVVLGEAIRMDTTSVAEVRFDPHDKATWGPGGTGALMFDRCRIGSTHGLVLVNSGGFKTTQPHDDAGLLEDRRLRLRPVRGNRRDDAALARAHGPHGPRARPGGQSRNQRRQVGDEMH